MHRLNIRDAAIPVFSTRLTLAFRYQMWNRCVPNTVFIHTPMNKSDFVNRCRIWQARIILHLGGHFFNRPALLGLNLSWII